MPQDALRPRFLRRMKEDVETLPEKEEVVVWVELTAQQRLFYKSIYEKKVCSDSTCCPVAPAVSGAVVFLQASVKPWPRGAQSALQVLSENVQAGAHAGAVVPVS